jgi:dephospho-CoA kinase
MLKVGVTGGIGSGKTLVCRIFEVLGIPIYYADIQAKKIMESDPHIRDGLVGLFGSAVINDNKINREYLASIIFNNNDALISVNNLVHPAVRRDFTEWALSMSEQDYIIEEAAILFESGIYRLLDFNIAVSAPEEMRIKRVIMRDNASRESVLSRLKNQMTENERNSLADAVIFNDESDLLIPQVIKVHNRILNIAGLKKDIN